MPLVRVNGIDMWYELAGEGPTLVLTHGFAGPTSEWPSVIAEFRDNYRLLLYDVRGHGLTSVPPAATFTLPQFAADLAGLLDALDIDRAHVGGVSMGGMISAQFACDFPDRLRSLILCDTTAGNGGDAATAIVEEQLAGVFSRYEHIVTKYGMKSLIEREVRYRHERDEHAARSSMSIEEQDAKNWRRLETMSAEGFVAAARAIRERPDLTDRLRLVLAPALVSCGEWDMFYPCAERDHRLLRSSRFATIRGAAHSTPDYQPHRWKRAVMDFIDDVEAGHDVRGEVTYAE